MKTNELPPPPDLSKIVPDGWDQVKTGTDKPGDAYLVAAANGQWRLVTDESWGDRASDFFFLIRRKPAPKKVRPLNAEEWESVAGCVMIGESLLGQWLVPPWWLCETEFLLSASKQRATCHPPCNPADIRPLFVEEGGE